MLRAASCSELLFLQRLFVLKICTVPCGKRSHFNLLHSNSRLYDCTCFLKHKLAQHNSFVGPSNIFFLKHMLVELLDTRTSIHFVTFVIHWLWAVRDVTSHITCIWSDVHRTMRRISCLTIDPHGELCS